MTRTQSDPRPGRAERKPPVLSDDSGAYSAYLSDAGGNRKRVRQDDGVHLTEAGADRLAPVVVDAINTMTPLY